MKKFLSVFLAVALIFGFAISSSGSDVLAKEQNQTVKNIGTQAIDLTGTWKSNDGGLYYIRQIGNQVWWSGMGNGGQGNNFSNVFRGTLNGDIITGAWADVPRGSILGSGDISLTVVYTGTGIQLKKNWSTGGFGGSLWYK